MFEKFRKKDTDSEITPGGSVVHRYKESEWAPSQIGFAERFAEFGEMRDKVYQRHFGEAKQVSHEIIPLLPHIDVVEYSRESQGKQVCVLVTSGMSDLAMNVPSGAEAPRRIELIFYCTEPKREYIQTLRWLAHFPHDQKTWIGAFHTIPNGNPAPALWGTAMDTIFLLPPLVKKDQNLQQDLILDGDGVEFLWLVPLTNAECQLKLAKGASTILDLFQKNRHPYVFDPNRSSYV